MSYQQQDENIIDGFESSEEDEDGSSLHFGDDFYGDEITDQSGQTTSDMYNSHQYNQQSIMQSQDEEEDDDGIMFNGIDSSFNNTDVSQTEGSWHIMHTIFW